MLNSSGSFDCASPKKIRPRFTLLRLIRTKTMSSSTSDLISHAISRGVLRQPFEPWMQNASTTFDITIKSMTPAERARNRALMIIKLKLLKRELKNAVKEGASAEEIECLASFVRLTRYLLRI